MAVAFVTSGSAETSSSGAQTIITGFNPGASNYAILAVASEGTPSVSAASLNGVSMGTSVHTNTSTGGGYTGLIAFALANPATGNLSITQGSTDSHVYGICTFSGVNTGAPLGTWVGDGTQVSDTDTTPTITGVDADGLFFSYASLYHGGTDGTVSVGGSEVIRVEDEYVNHVTLVCSTKAGAASTTMTSAATNATRVNLAGVYIAAAAAGGRSTKNTRAWTLGVNAGMGHRMPI